MYRRRPKFDWQVNYEGQRMSKTVLEVKDLVTRFYSVDGVVHAVNGVSFTLDEGETLGVVGESGSGKSVTMMSLVGLIPQPPGKVEGGQAWLHTGTNSVDLLTLSENKVRKVRGSQIGFIFQDPISSLNPVMTIGRQISEAVQEHLHLSEKAAKERTIQLLQFVGIPDAPERYNSYPHQFSGGMRQRVVIAIAVACDPKIVIADEPTTALDVTVQAQIIELVKRLQAQMGMAVIWISHDLGVVAGLADRVIVMYGGTVVESTAVFDLYENPQHPYTIGLLQAVPSFTEGGETPHELASIKGAPPDLLHRLRHCPFAERCQYAFERCWEEVPPLMEVRPDHWAACFYDVAAGRPRNDR
jgi:oligopeptide transport system ATP-binding protein